MSFTNIFNSVPESKEAYIALRGAQKSCHVNRLTVFIYSYDSWLHSRPTKKTIHCLQYIYIKRVVVQHPKQNVNAPQILESVKLKA